VATEPVPDGIAGADVTDNREASRFEVTIGGHTAFLAYERTDDELMLIHTEVPPALRGRHLGDRLARTAIDAGRSAGLRIATICPFVKAYLHKHG
jgi:predicted GNAT family acetyltransferase